MFTAANATPGGRGAMFGNSGPRASSGQDLDDVQTDVVGFQGLAGEAKVRLLPAPWPQDEVPEPTCSLFSIASRTGLLATAGPGVLVIAKTEDVRKAFSNQEGASNNIKNFASSAHIQVPSVSQVTFSSDEKYLIICARQGGGLAVYDVQALQQGNTNPTLQLATDNHGVRALVPNPAEENGHLLAVVLDDGKLMIANLKDQTWVQGGNGPVIKDGQVSTASWSVRGKQLTAGLADGSALQLKPDGQVASTIPRPPQLEENCYISSLSWLANDNWLMIYNPTSFDSERAPESAYFLVTREPKTENYMFHKVGDPTPPFGLNRSPPHHFISRLRKFDPNLEDALLVTSTASGDIGLISNSTAPLANDPQAMQAVNKYAMTMMADDTRRASMPVSDEMSDTSPIGMAIDLSPREHVKRPLPNEETLDSSSSPVPALMVLNHEGVLAAWWFIYSDSIKEHKPYHGLAAVASTRPSSGPAVASPVSNKPAFGASTFGSAINQGTPATPAFGSGASFGSTALPGSAQSVWSSASKPGSNNFQTAGASFGQPAFGTSSSIGSSNKSFGNGLSSPSRTFGAPGNKQSQGASAFASLASGDNNTSASPFANAKQESGGSIFGKNDGTNESGKTLFGSQGQPSGSLFGKPSDNTTSSSSPFANVGKQDAGFGFGQNVISPEKPPGLGSQPSFGSTMTIGSSFGVQSAPGSNQTPWATPSLSNKTSDQSAKHDQSRAHDQDEDMAMDKPENLFGSSMANLQLEKNEKVGVADRSESEQNDGKESKPQLEKPAEVSETQQLEEAPLPPDPSTKVASKIKDAEKAPLPPDPTQSIKTSEPEVAPLPSLPDIKKEPSQEPSPLPPSPEPSVEAKDRDPPSFAGSPPVDLGAAGSRSVSPARSLNSTDGPTQDSIKAPTSQAGEQEFRSALTDSKPSWSFAPIQNQTPSKDKVSHEPFSSPLGSLKPDANESYTPPTSAMQPPVFFQPPGGTHESPRSPSPIRDQHRASSSLRRQSPRRSLSPSRRVATSPQRVSPMGPSVDQTPNKSGFPKQYSVGPDSTSPTHAPAQETTHEGSRPPAQRVTSRVSESKQHTDDDNISVESDDASEIAQVLEAPLLPTKNLDTFMTHRDYVRRISGQEIPAHVERLYRDIDSMLDTMGLNARALGNFAKYHSEKIRDDGREREHLEPGYIDDWCLDEIEALGIVTNDLTKRLDAERPQDVGRKIRELREVQHTLFKMRSRTPEIQREVDMRMGAADAQEVGLGKTRLTTEQSEVLRDLRVQYAKVQTQISKTEDTASYLRAQMVSRGLLSSPGTASSNGSLASIGSSGRANRAPTAEAIINTIAKMTRMAEQKRSDVDLLESKMRRLKFVGPRDSPMRSTVGPRENDDLGLGRLSLSGRQSLSREGSPKFSTPPSTRFRKSVVTKTKKASNTLSDGSSPSYAVPESSDEEDEEDVKDSGNPFLPKVTREEIEEFKARKMKRAKTMQLLKKTLVELENSG